MMEFLIEKRPKHCFASIYHWKPNSNIIQPKEPVTVGVIFVTDELV